MNRRTLALGFIAGGMTLPFVGGHAGAADVCDSMHAATNPTLTVDQDSATFTATARPGCEGADFSLAVHRTNFLTFDPSETQPLVASATGQLGVAPVSLTVVFPGLVGTQCNYQLDGVAGRPLSAVSPTSRYNTFPLGGDLNRLVVADYAANDCEEVGPPASPPVTVPDAPPPPVIMQAPPTPIPPGLQDVPTTAGTEPLEPAPSTTLAAELDVPVVTAGSLPVTGGVNPLVVSALVAVFVALAWTVQLYGAARAWQIFASALQPASNS